MSLYSSDFFHLFQYFFVSFLESCTLPTTSEMMDDIDEKMGKKLKW